MKEYFEEEIRERAQELDSKDDMLSVGLLTLASFTSSERAQMFTQHIVQSWVLNNPEVPRIFTGYEQMFGEYSGSIKTNKHKCKIHRKIQKHGDWIYTLVTYDKSKDFYDIIQRNEVKHLSEIYGYRINNETIDSYNEGDTIHKNEMLYRAPSTDEYRNYKYGMNAKIAYLISSKTIEDGIVVSKSFAKKMSCTYVEKVAVPLNENDILLNLFGDKKNYKSFPNLGEYTKDSIICATRRRDKIYDQYNLKNSKLREISSSDTIYQKLGDWQVCDIDLWINKDVDLIPSTPAYKQLKDCAIRIRNYWLDVYNTLDEIISSGSEYSQELSQLYAKARDYLDDSAKFAHEDRMFSNIVMEFTIAKTEPLRVGCKLAGRFGNKSVISRIQSDEEMGVTEDGVHPDIWVDALGVLGRLNSGQVFEQELCWIADKVERNIVDKGDPHDDKIRKWQMKYLLNFIKKVSKDQYEYLSNKNMSKEDEIELIEGFINGTDHLKIQQPPLDCITGDDLFQLYNDYDMKKSPLYFYNPNGSKYRTIRTLIVADEYFLRLKQEPITKLSQRSMLFINPINSTPMKSTGYKKSKLLVQDQANKLGEQELAVFMLANDPAALSYFYRASSGSVVGRRDETIYTEDPSNGFIIKPKSNKSCSVDKFNALLKTIGFSLDIDIDDKNDDEEDYDIIDELNESFKTNTDNIPKYIKDLEYGSDK